MLRLFQPGHFDAALFTPNMFFISPFARWWRRRGGGGLVLFAPTLVLLGQPIAILGIDHRGFQCGLGKGALNLSFNLFNLFTTRYLNRACHRRLRQPFQSNMFLIKNKEFNFVRYLLIFLFFEDEQYYLVCVRVSLFQANRVFIKEVGVTIKRKFCRYR